MLSHSPSKKSLQIEQDNKLFSKLQSKERTSSTVSGTPSFRVYYGGVSGSVPFLWESQPGTPKHPCFSDSSSLPPLTPPPSYYSHSHSKQHSKKNPRSNLLTTLLFKINPRKSHIPSSPTPSPSFSSVSSRSSSHSSVSFPTTSSKGRNQFSSEGSSFDEEEEVSIGSPNSTLCLGLGRAPQGQRNRRCLVCATGGSGEEPNV